MLSWDHLIHDGQAIRREFITQGTKTVTKYSMWHEFGLEIRSTCVSM